VLLALSLLLLLLPPAHAATPTESAWGDVDGAGQPGAAPDAAPASPGPLGGFSALGLLQVRLSRSSIVPTNPFLDGQIVGQLGGLNGTTTSLEDRSTLAEQRADAFLTWAPRVLDGRAALTAAFEVDYVWGDQAYQTGGNKGGGFGGDQVNLQTRRLYGRFSPRLPGGNDLTVYAGLQFLSDGAHDPHTSTPDALFRHGGGLMFWGSEAAGLAAYGRVHDSFGDRLFYRVGGFTLLENGVAQADDATLWVADAEVVPAYAVDLGLHAWWLKDGTGGSGGSLGVGPTSQLSQLQGGPRLSFLSADGTAVETDADLVWLGADAGWNRDLDRGPVGLRGLGVLNLGRLYLTGQPDVDVRGWLVDGEARWRWTRGAGSELRVEGLASSRDGTGSGAYTGVVTGNSYGVVGASWTTHGTLLLFSDPQAIDRQVAVVSDVSGGGHGLAALCSRLGYDPIPNRLTVTANVAHAAQPQQGAVGTETGLAVVAHPLPLLDVGLRGAVVSGARVPALDTGDLSSLPAWPWAIQAHLQWVLF